MKCLNCKYVEITEYGCKGFIGETVLLCKICNDINSEDCEDFKEIKDTF